MKKVLIYFFGFIVFMTLLSLVYPTDNDQKNQENENVVENSIKDEQIIEDKNEAPVINEEAIKKYKPFFIEEQDEFSECMYVLPKNKPKYRNSNGIYCYFAYNDKEVGNFRFVYQYYNDDWLFIQSMIFNIDGENFTINPDMERDCGNGHILEWFDEQIDHNVLYRILVGKIAYSKNVKIKLVGRQYSDVRTLTAAQIKSIRDTYEYYLALGGKFN